MGISYNKAILVGRLTADPVISYSSNGLQIAKFTLAVDRQQRGKNQQGQQEVDFLRIVVFGKTAEFASNYLAKGRLIMVEGRIQVSRYQAQDGSTRYSTDIVAENIRFMETKGNSSEKPKDSDVIFNNESSDDDEVPF